METGEKFVPHHVFSGDFCKILQNIKTHHLTTTEKAVLKTLEFFCYKDGRCYPRQETIAKHVGDVGERQVRNLIKSLEQKGFIEVKRASLIERRLYGLSNRYFFVWHPLYALASDGPVFQDEYDAVTAGPSLEATAGPSAAISADTPLYKGLKGESPKSEKSAIAPSACTAAEKQNLKDTLTNIFNDISKAIPEHEFNPRLCFLHIDKKYGRRHATGDIYGKACIETFTAIRRTAERGTWAGKPYREVVNYAVAIYKQVVSNLNAEHERLESERRKAADNDMIRKLRAERISFEVGSRA